MEIGRLSFVVSWVTLWNFFLLSGQPSQQIPPLNESIKQNFQVSWQDTLYRGNAYRLFIAKPKGTGPARRPVLYMLDGNGQFPVLLNEICSVSDATPYIVGIGYPSAMAYPKERGRDYTFPWKGHEEGGGAENFYNFLVGIVKPFIESKFNIDATKQTLCGHSYGGLFTLYVLFNHPQEFTRYVAGSPALWWGEGKILQEKKVYLSHPPQSVTITLGEYEENPVSDPERKKLSPEVLKIKDERRSPVSARQLADMLSQEIPNCHFVLFEGENHGSSVPDFLLEALRVAGE